MRPSIRDSTDHSRFDPADGCEGADKSQKISSDVDPLTYVDAVTGISGWSDNSDTINLCRDILKAESGIEIPDSSLVFRSLGWYLLILVPINYLIFRLMGRLEYAWLAVPVIAVGGAIWVARAARLDIGFARSQTELAVLELPANYSRGHLTRIIAIYNSLSSRYDIDFKTIDGAPRLSTSTWRQPKPMIACSRPRSPKDPLCRDCRSIATKSSWFIPNR